MSAPLLVFAWGNRSRGDDALGPLFLEGLRAAANEQPSSMQGEVEFLEDYQLQIEHALDLAHRRKVLFVDASHDCRAPFEIRTLAPARDGSFTSHALSPESLLQVFRDVHRAEPPHCALLAIRGASFELGAPLGASAAMHLDHALQWGRRWLETRGAVA
jgi:hydrogenase maturation protease